MTNTIVSFRPRTLDRAGPIGGPGRQPAALVTSTIVSFSRRPRQLQRCTPRYRRAGRSSAGGPGDEHGRQLHAPDLDQAEPIGGPGRQPAALVTSRASASRSGPSTGPSRASASAGGPGDEHGRQLQAPDLNQAEHGRQLQPVAPVVTSIDVEISGRAGRQPAALVTSMIVSFTLRTSTRPSRSSAGGAALVTSTIVSGGPRGDEHGRQLHAPDPRPGRADRQPAALPLVTSMIVSFTLRTLTGPSRSSASADGPRGDEHRRGNRRRAGRASAGGPGDEHGRQLHAPDLDQAEHGRQLQPAALVTSIDVEISGRADRQPVALVTNTGVSFRPRTSTRPSRSAAPW